ncbi:DUF1003 domain-containing protein [Leucobacter soli]|uniref:DUF1003 domain-containing protein n=1 Tax=Leucobacter soli TaxID=2812850 RepID=A0A916NLD7_9MICO|nr:DUF1003 domain-containing protein [Leucobacter soli]CAG7601217.1 hypothetical protein LEUCIP111803_00438 [Leucobacter soli]
MSFFGRRSAATGLDSPQTGARVSANDNGGNEVFGRWSEGIARGMGTPWFLLVLTFFCVIWLVWNTLAPETWRFDSAALGFTALTLILSLQASYAAPLILLAQNRQDDRDRVQIEQDRQRAERNLADTEFLAREVVALRLAIKDLPDRDFVRAELRALLADLETGPETAPEDAGEIGEDQLASTDPAVPKNSATSAGPSDETHTGSGAGSSPDADDDADG